MKMFRNLYTKAQEMSEEKVLDTNSIITALFKRSLEKRSENIFF